MSSQFPGSPVARIVSMDQFRGCIVLGMVLVNYASEFKWISDNAPVLEHHNTYFSFADTIMPAFNFAVGFSLRLTLLRYWTQKGLGPTFFRAVRRILGLILIGIVLEFVENKRPEWAELYAKSFWDVLGPLLKSGVLNTLVIIAVTSLWILPVIACRGWIRFLYLLFSLALHLIICYYFYFDFMEGRPNGLSDLWGFETMRGLDGGPFGFLAWAFPQLIGSFVYDWMASGRKKTAFVGILFLGILFSAAGYGLSCLSTLYPLTYPPSKDEGGIQIAESPMVPPGVDLKNIDFKEILAKTQKAEWPFVQPAPENQRQLSYWLMCKRVVTLPFQLASTGYSLVFLAVFMLLCDFGHLSIGIFRTFGENPLATYIIHEIVGTATRSLAPKDAPWEWVVCSFIVYLGVTYLFVRHLEKHRIYLRM